MNSMSTRALSAARPVIQALTALNVLYALVVTAVLVSSFFMQGWPERPLGIELVSRYPWAPTGLRVIVVIGIVGAVIVHFVLRRLLAIVDTVRAGDPFITANAQRLNAIAWSVLALELLRMVVAGIASAVWVSGKIEGFSFAPWLAVLLFVLSGVFAHGARMRADLEGTV